MNQAKKILLIDDSNTIRKSGEIFLKKSGYITILAEDGFEGVIKAVQEVPDLIFIDVMMPKLDGYQACALIRNIKSIKHIPIVMLTSKDTLLDRAKGDLSGASLYL